MNTLAIDTSASYLSLAIEANNQVYKFTDKVDNNQSVHIIPQIERLLVQANIKLDEISFIAYNQGPGSFTGLRIGLSVALGLAFGIKAKLIPIPTFAIYALQAYKHTGCSQVLVGLDARLNQLYYAGVNMPDFEYFIKPKLLNPQDVVIPSNTVAIGLGFSVYSDQIPNQVQDLVNEEYPDAGYLLELAKSGKFKIVSTNEADLLYLRNKVALSLDEQQNANKISRTH